MFCCHLFFLNLAFVDCVLVAVHVASNNVDEAIIRTNRLSNQTSRLRQLGADIGHSILELQRLIGEARAQAASVSITQVLRRGGFQL